MKTFVELADTITEETVVLDLDGTLVPDGGNTLSAPVAQKLISLASRSRVYVLSNNPRGRLDALAREFKVNAIKTSARKPSLRTLAGIDIGESLAIVGDKYLTDGILALRAKAKFYHVESLRAGSDSAAVRASYGVDSTLSKLFPLLEMARPTQWIKNGLLFAPLFFAGSVFNSLTLAHVVAAFFGFSFAASVGYILNDIQDKAADALHPKKRFRPLVRGGVSIIGAWQLIFFLCVGFFISVSFVPQVAIPIILYVVSSFVYSKFLKHVPIVEIVAVALFYNARLVVGGIAASVFVSDWLHTTVFFVALFLVAGKRYAESRHSEVRAVLKSYPAEFLHALPAITAALAMVSYSLYSIIGSGKQGMVYTIPLAAAGVLLYLNSIYSHENTESFEEALFSSTAMSTVVVLWGALVFYLFYFH